MKQRLWSNVPAWSAKLTVSLALLAGVCAYTGTAIADSSMSCDRALPAITGYGADGPYSMDAESLPNPSFRRKSVMVFLPKGAAGRRPAVFFSHGYGPNRWEAYEDLIRHVVSLGYVLVYSTYPAMFADNDERYQALWGGFEAAAKHFADRIDLSRVGFIGHSYGGGATPDMAYRGFVEKGWGKSGAFMMEMAPWYSYQITPAQWQQFPGTALQLVEVYDKDDINDHRMAIAIYNDSHMTRNYFLMVHSSTVGGCNIIADHMTPGRSTFLNQKRYGVFRPLDALADCAFTQTTAACNALAAMGHENAGGGYQPLRAESKPTPAEAESFYKFPWGNDKNPQLQR